MKIILILWDLLARNQTDLLIQLNPNTCEYDGG